MFQNNENDLRYSTLTDRDILLFIWRWKITSMALLVREFESKVSVMWVYRRVQRLIDSKHLHYVHLKDFNGFGIGLTKKGFFQIRDCLETAEKAVHRSEAPAHDFIVSALQYGLFNIHRSFFHSAITESELRCISPQTTPASIPNSGVHRPDGYLLAGVMPSSGVIAIEVELSKKNETRYRQLADFYSKYVNVFGVWIAQTTTIAENIAGALNANSNLKGKRHLIYKLDDLISDEWNAPSCFGDAKGTKLSELVASNYCTNSVQLASKWSLRGLFSTRKRPLISGISKAVEKLKIVSAPGVHYITPSLNITPATSNFDPAINHPNNKEEPPHE